MNLHASSNVDDFRPSAPSLCHVHEQKEAPSTAAIPVRDPSARAFLLSHLISALEASEQSNITQMFDAGITPGLLDALRRLTITDISRFAQSGVGMSISLDCRRLAQDLARFERSRQDRGIFEDLIRAGATPGLLARLFGMPEAEVRRQRRVIAPESAKGGRPRQPDDADLPQIDAAWRDLLREDLAERERYWRLAAAFPGYPLAALELVVGR